MVYVISILIFGLDYITKWLALTHLIEHVPQSVFPFFNLYLTHNTGVSFSMFSARSELGTALLIGIALAICLAIVYMIRQEHNRINRIALAMILGGALGNVWDRIQYGAVIDFLDFHWQQYHFPSFNVADTAISVGAMLLIFEIIRRKK